MGLPASLLSVRRQGNEWYRLNDGQPKLDPMCSFGAPNAGHGASRLAPGTCGASERLLAGMVRFTLHQAADLLDIQEYAINIPRASKFQLSIL